MLQLKKIIKSKAIRGQSWMGDSACPAGGTDLFYVGYPNGDKISIHRTRNISGMTAISLFANTGLNRETKKYDDTHFLNYFFLPRDESELTLVLNML